jgi:hypothetical protein
VDTQDKPGTPTYRESCIFAGQRTRTSKEHVRGTVAGNHTHEGSKGKPLEEDMIEGQRKEKRESNIFAKKKIKEKMIKKATYMFPEKKRKGKRHSSLVWQDCGCGSSCLSIQCIHH